MKRAPMVVSVRHLEGRHVLSRNGRVLDKYLSVGACMSHAIQLGRDNRGIVVYYDYEDGKPDAVRDFRHWRKGRKTPRLKLL